VHTAGPDDAFGTSDDVKIDGIVRLKTGNRRIWWRPRVAVPFAAGTTFSVKVTSKNVKSAGTSERIDGDFNGPGLTSGNGTAGGDLLFLSKRDKGTVPVARFSTVEGNIDVNMNTTQTADLRQLPSLCGQRPVGLHLLPPQRVSRSDHAVRRPRRRVQRVADRQHRRWPQRHSDYRSGAQ